MVGSKKQLASSNILYLNSKEDKKRREDESRFKDVVNGTAAWPLSTFESYLIDEHATENLYFYRDVQKYKQDADNLQEMDQLESASNILQTYVTPGAESEVNISGKARKALLDKLSPDTNRLDTGEASSDMFDEAHNEIEELMEHDSYPRFIRLVRSTNLNESLANGAMIFGLQLFISGFIISTIFIAVQFYAEDQLQSKSNATLETLNNRLWRLLGFPLMYLGIAFLIVGKMKICAICATSGVNYANTDNQAKYTKVIWNEIIVNILHIKRSTSVTDDENTCKVCVMDIQKANKKRADKFGAISLLISMIFMAILLLIPPNSPKWY